MKISSKDFVTAFQNQFPDLDEPELLEEISSKTKLVTVSQGDILMDYGDKVDAVPLVMEGSLKISRLNEKEQEVFLYYLSPGDSCAASFSCCMVKKRSEVMAVAEEDSEILFIPLTVVDEWMGKYTVWRNFVFSMYDQRMFALIDTIDRLAFSKLDDQLLDYLDRTADALQTKTISTTHQKIALDLNASREAVSRLLKKLERQGNIKLERNRIHLLS